LFIEELSLELQKMFLGGPGGLEIQQFKLMVNSINLPFVAGDIPEVRISGALALPDIGDLQFQASLVNGVLDLETTGSVTLGAGIVLMPQDDKPVLALQVAGACSGLASGG